MAIDTPMQIPPTPPRVPEAGPETAPPVGTTPSSGSEFDANDIAEANQRMHLALVDGFDPVTQLGDAELDIDELVAMQAAVSKLDPQEHRQTILEFQLLFLQILRELKQANRESAQHARTMMVDAALQSFESLMEAAKKEYETALTQGIGQIVTGVAQGTFSLGADQTAVLRGQAAGSATSGIAGTIAAGTQHDAAAARAESALHDKDREVLQGDVQRAQENAADASESLSALTHSVDDQLKAEAELQKSIARAGS